MRQVIKDTSDKTLKAQAYNTLGVSYFNGEYLKEARWDFLWVDVVYNQDRAEHAKALYYLWKIFDKLDEKERAQECRDALSQRSSVCRLGMAAARAKGNAQVSVGQVFNLSGLVWQNHTAIIAQTFPPVPAMPVVSYALCTHANNAGKSA